MRKDDEEREKKKRRKGFKWVLAIAGLANKLPWWLALLLGGGLFAGLYWGVPKWAQGQLDEAQDTFYRPLVESIVGSGVPWVQWLAIAVGGACGILAVKNFFKARRQHKAQASDGRPDSPPSEPAKNRLAREAATRRMQEARRQGDR